MKSVNRVNAALVTGTKGTNHGMPNTAARISHWPMIRCPVLLLSGEADPFGRVELLRQSVKLLPNARLVTWPGLGHGVKPVLDEALDRVAAFLREVKPAEPSSA